MNILRCGSTRSGKSTASLSDIVDDADNGDCTVIALDPHGESLAKPAVGHLHARGHGHRTRFDRFSDFKHVLKWRFLKASNAENLFDREAENEEAIRLFASMLTRQQEGGPLNATPLKEEWTLKACRFYINQRAQQNLADLPQVFDPTSKPFARFMKGCTCEKAATPFRHIAEGSIKPNEYRPAERLIGAICNAPTLAVRCGGVGEFDFEGFCDRKGILLIEGESKGNVSPEAQRAMFGAVLIKTFRYVRTRPKPYPRIRVYLDEANNARLISQHEKAALAECQKYGLDLIIMVQNLDFPSTEITKGVLSNCLRHEWFYNGNADVLRKANEDLGGRAEDNYIERMRGFVVGERGVKVKTNGREQVYFDRAPKPTDPYGIPGLMERKIELAIEAMHRSSEYRNLGDDESCDTPTTETGTMTSSNKPGCTPAQPTNLPDSSIADLLSMDESEDSEPEADDDSDQLEPPA